MSKCPHLNSLMLILIHVVVTVANRTGLQRIIHGQMCEIKHYPFAVQYYQRLSSGDIKGCGGSLLTYQWVLSAAQCFHTGQTLLETVVVAGTAAAHFRVEKSKGIVRKVIKQIPHPEYMKEMQRVTTNDILLAKVEKPFPKDHPWIKPAQLPQPGFTSTARTAMIMGWGQQTPIPIDEKLIKQFPEYFRNVEPVFKYKPFKDTLMCVQIPVAQQHECQRNYPKEFKIWPSHICGSPYDEKDTCIGDTGGPMAVNQTIIGITSGGLGCGQNAYKVYTRVDMFFDFMREHVENLVIPEDIKQLEKTRGKPAVKDSSTGIGESAWLVLALVLCWMTTVVLI